MKADPESGAQSNMADVLIRRGRRQGCTCIERGHGWAQEKKAVFKPRRRASGETRPAHTLDSDFRLQNCEGTHFRYLRHPFCDILL